MSIKTRVWIVGHTGRLGSALNSMLDRRNFQIITTDIYDVDITNLHDVELYADRHRPDIIVNCASRSDRQWCEDNPQEAYALHALGARNLAIAAEHIGAHIFYLSTDFVFDGLQGKPYTEFDKPNPQTIYGKSKLAGENFVKDHCTQFTILRSSWLYGKKHINNIVREAREKKRVSVYKTIVGSPTSSLELAETLVNFINTPEYGTFHISCEGDCTQREFVKKVLELLNIEATLYEADKPTEFEIMRPQYSVLDNMMLRLTKHKNMKHWEEALSRFITERKIGR